MLENCVLSKMDIYYKSPLQEWSKLSCSSDFKLFLRIKFYLIFYSEFTPHNSLFCLQDNNKQTNKQKGYFDMSYKS